MASHSESPSAVAEGLRKPSGWAWVLPLAALAGTLFLAFVPLNGPICPFKTILHLPCPGCGLTRSFVAAWQGRWLLSFRYHPLGLPLMAAFTGALVLPRLLPAPQLHRLSDRVTSRPAQMIGLALLVGFGLLRIGLVLSGNEWLLWR